MHELVLSSGRGLAFVKAKPECRIMTVEKQEEEALGY